MAVTFECFLDRTFGFRIEAVYLQSVETEDGRSDMTLCVSGNVLELTSMRCVGTKDGNPSLVGTGNLRAVRGPVVHSSPSAVIRRYDQRRPAAVGLHGLKS